MSQTQSVKNKATKIKNGPHPRGEIKSDPENPGQKVLVTKERYIGFGGKLHRVPSYTYGAVGKQGPFKDVRSIR